MIDKGFQKGIIQKIDTKNPNFNNFQGINALFVEYLKKLNVPFFNECCPANSVITPIGYREGDVVVYNTTTNQWDILAISGGGGSVEPVEGIIPISGIVSVGVGDTVISNPNWAGRYLLVMRDGFRIPPYNPGTGAMYYTKVLSSDTLTLSVATVAGEDLFIMVI